MFALIYNLLGIPIAAGKDHFILFLSQLNIHIFTSLTHHELCMKKNQSCVVQMITVVLFSLVTRTLAPPSGYFEKRTGCC